MAEINSTKVCTGCKTEKPLTEFNRNSGRSGHRPKCKACNHAIDSLNRKTPHGKENGKKAHAKYRATEHGKQTERGYYQRVGKERLKHYALNNPEIRKATALKYRQSALGKATKRRIYTQNKDHWQAGTAVFRAVKKGILPRVIDCKCARCSQPAKEYHHWSYKKKWWLSVIPLCKSCHIFIHLNTPRRETSSC